ncbi:MAG TPA: acyl-CoA dehydrogenase family protein [Bacillaceae bacterium]|nr:acyl-CoA dehydrogenase family protein [Paenibacillus bovis]HLU21549.1 acyl-CoA dehydrogenase family protein [Bacillaceae bacterium]
MFTKETINKLRSHSKHMDQKREVPAEVLDWMYAEKLFKLFVPETLGGRMLTLPEAVQVFQKTAAIDGNIGWLTTIGSGGGMFVANFTEEWADKLFTPENAVLAGSGHPTGKGVKTDDGYIVNGTWRYCSGSQFASFFTANCMTDDDEIVSFILMKEQVQVVEDWDAFGLKATGSHTIKVENALVPEDRTFSIFEIKNNFKGLVHSFPFVQFSQASFAAVCLGIGEHFYEEATAIAEKNKDRWSELRFSNVTDKIKEQESVYKGAVDNFYSGITSSWNNHEAGISLLEEELEAFSSTCKQSAQATFDGVQSLIRMLGMEAVMESSTLNRIWRDLYTAGQHSFLTQ